MGEINRPNGGGAMGAGWAALTIGSILVFIGLVLPTFSDPGRDAIGAYVPAVLPTINPWKWPLTWLGIGLTNVGVLLLSIGYVVRAIFFLPGRTIGDDDLTIGGVLPTGAETSANLVPSSQPALSTTEEKADADRFLIKVAVAFVAIAAVVVLAVTTIPGSGSVGNIGSQQDEAYDIARNVEAAADALEAEADAAVDEAYNQATAVRDH